MRSSALFPDQDENMNSASVISLRQKITWTTKSVKSIFSHNYAIIPCMLEPKRMIWVLNGISMICTHTSTHASPGLELAGSGDMITPGPVLSDRLIIQHAHKINQNYMFLCLCLLSLHTHRVSSARSIIQRKAPGQEDG